MTLLKHNPAVMGNFFDEVLNTIPMSWSKDPAQSFAVPPANIHEMTEAYLVELSVPGRSKENFSINVDKGQLTISFEKKEVENKEGKIIRKEFAFNSFKRSFTLDDKINTSAIHAKYEDGLLKVYLPKKEEVIITPQTIPVQ